MFNSERNVWTLLNGLPWRPLINGYGRLEEALALTELGLKLSQHKFVYRKEAK